METAALNPPAIALFYNRDADLPQNLAGGGGIVGGQGIYYTAFAIRQGGAHQSADAIALGGGGGDPAAYSAYVN
jgi:hypothetical protein